VVEAERDSRGPCQVAAERDDAHVQVDPARTNSVAVWGSPSTMPARVPVPSGPTRSRVEWHRYPEHLEPAHRKGAIAGRGVLEGPGRDRLFCRDRQQTDALDRGAVRREGGGRPSPRELSGRVGISESSGSGHVAAALASTRTIGGTACPAHREPADAVGVVEGRLRMDTFLADASR
jgi:hypothetical protein